MHPTAETWGTTAEERALDWPCDRHLKRPHEGLWRGVTVDAPAATVFRWLCQLRVAPYSYDLIDNFGRRSPRTLIDGLERLQTGQRFMAIFDLVEFEQDRHITLSVRRLRAIFGSGAVTYMTIPDGERRTRLLLKIATPPHGTGPAARASGAAWPWLELFMSRKQLLTLKELAERADPAEPAPPGRTRT
jgi:hypothetical protein